MEIYSATTRFALACNNSTKLIEPIQSRCAILRYSRLSNEQVARRLLQVIRAESVPYDESGIEALLFTTEGDMRNALNNLQSTFAGFGMVTGDNVFRVCDQPHPRRVEAMLRACIDCQVKPALDAIGALWSLGCVYSGVGLGGMGCAQTCALVVCAEAGWSSSHSLPPFSYSALDIVTTIFRVVKAFEMPEATKLTMIQAVSGTHMRISDGVGTLLQLQGLVARMCDIAGTSRAVK